MSDIHQRVWTQLALYDRCCELLRKQPRESLLDAAKRIIENELSDELEVNMANALLSDCADPWQRLEFVASLAANASPSPKPRAECPACDGRGYVPVPPYEHGVKTKSCAECKGTGKAG